MHITRLRLVGFKSFVEPTELIIEHGLTGVVGPNGCGKSNLLEAIRWVMGDSSYKSMRGSAMDDVIFSGTTARPARNNAEVTIFLDNRDRRAPAGFNDGDTLEITRRIEREAGSIFRLNGQDVRARDVKVLFEDAATGARSPALVRQGQIAEIVNAKPEQRRRILEDAAGIAGLQTRRHEAELRLRAAEANIARLGDVLGQLMSQISNLKRQARQARRYKEISGEIRQAEAIQQHLAWLAAKGLVDQEEAALLEALKIVGLATEAEAKAIRAEAEAADALPGLREAEAVRGAVLQRLEVEDESLSREEERARARQGELATRVGELERDVAREAGLVAEAAAALAGLGEESEALSRQPAASEAAEAEARARLDAARAALGMSEAELSRLTSEFADLKANRRRLMETIAGITSQRERVEHQLAASTSQLAQMPDAIADQAGIADEVAAAQALASSVEARIVRLEASLSEIHAGEREARQTSTAFRLGAERLGTERATLRRLLVPPTGDGLPAIVDALKVKRGFEAALGAALGDDLDAPADPAAPAHWALLATGDDDPSLPAGAAPLSAAVKGPQEIARRLTQIGVVDRAEGRRLQALLKPGQRLVSREGDLWRWDGYSAAAEAPTAAARRLAQRNRLEEIETELAEALAAAEAADRALSGIEARRGEATANERQLRSEHREHLAATQRLRDQLQRSARAQQEAALRRAALAEAIARTRQTRDEHLAAIIGLEVELAGLAGPARLEQALETCRTETGALRQALAECQATLAGLERERRQRAERLAAIAGDSARWRTRRDTAETQRRTLDGRLADARHLIADLAGVPEQIAGRRRALLSEIERAETERKAAADALALADTRLRECVRILREVQGELALAREERARTEVRLEAARTLRSEAARKIREVYDCAPDGCLAAVGLGGDAGLPSHAEAERRLVRLREDRERLGGVNLRADEELGELTAQHDGMDKERADLEQAIAELRQGIGKLNREAKKRLSEAFEQVNRHFQKLFGTLFGGGEARLEMIESEEDPLAGGLEIIAKPPGKKPATLSLLSGGEQTLTALSLIFAVFLTNPSPICVLDEVDAPLDDANVDRFCTMMDEMARSTATRFLVITHHPMTMSRVHRLFGVTMAEKGVSQLVSVDLATAERFRETG